MANVNLRTLLVSPLGSLVNYAPDDTSTHSVLSIMSDLPNISAAAHAIAAHVKNYKTLKSLSESTRVFAQCTTCLRDVAKKRELAKLHMHLQTALIRIAVENAAKDLDVSFVQVRRAFASFSHVAVARAAYRLMRAAIQWIGGITLTPDYDLFNHVLAVVVEKKSDLAPLQILAASEYEYDAVYKHASDYFREDYGPDEESSDMYDVLNKDELVEYPGRTLNTPLARRMFTSWFSTLPDGQLTIKDFAPAPRDLLLLLITLALDQKEWD